MKIIINTGEMKDVVKRALKIISKKHKVELLKNLYIKAEDNNITMIATNLLSDYLVFDVEGEIIEEGHALLDIEELNLISKLKTKNITIQDDKIISDNKEIKLDNKYKEYNIEEYPVPIPEINNCNTHAFTTTEHELAQLLKIKYAISEDDHKPALNTLVISHDSFTTCDSFRIATRKLPFENKIQDKILVVKYTIDLLNNIINKKSKNDIKCFVDQDLNKIIFQIDNMKLYSTLSQEVYPSVERVIPEEYQAEITVDKKHLTEELDFVGGKSKNLIRLIFSHSQDDNEIYMTANTNLNDESKNKNIKIKLDIEQNGNTFEDFALNYKFVNDTIKNTEDDKINISIPEKLNVIKIQDDYIMPIVNYL